MIHVGIDPGVGGGIVVLRGGKVYPHPLNRLDWDSFVDLVSSIPKHGATQFAVEKIPLYIPGVPGKTQMPLSRMGKLYGSYKELLATCKMISGTSPSSVTTVEFIPQKWQRVVGCTNPERLERDAWKRKLREYAAQIAKENRWDFKPSLATADAFLIAYASKLTWEAAFASCRSRL